MDPSSSSVAIAVEAPPIDRPSLVARCMGDAGFAGLIVGKFQAQLPTLAERIEQAVAAGDAAAAGRAGHALKGAAANLSAAGLQAAAGRIEAAGHAGDPASAAAALASLRAEVARCQAHLPALLAELQRQPAAAAA